MSVSCSVVSNSLQPHGLSPTRFLCPWGSPGKNTRMSCHSLLQLSSWPRDRTQVSYIAASFFTIWATSLVQFSRSVVSNSLWLHESQHARPPCPSPTPGVHPDSHPLSQWCHPAISSSSPSPPAPNPSQHQSLFQWVNSSHEVAKVLEFQL